MIEVINSVDEIAREAADRGITISELALEIQAKTLKQPESALLANMRKNLEVMRESAKNGMADVRSASGLSGGAAKKLSEKKSGLIGDLAHSAAVFALAISEHNACMGRIVASPTAGSCGILPGVLLAIGEHKNISDERLTMALFNAGAIGMAIAENATLSGAEGGCAAECGSAGAMAASAAVELMGGTPAMCASACAIALKAVMGLVCDPIAGLVEVPCVKRNATGAIIALTAAELALSGIESVVCADEVIGAMKSVGCMMDRTLRETSLGGLAATKTAKRIADELSKGVK